MEAAARIDAPPSSVRAPAALSASVLPDMSEVDELDTELARLLMEDCGTATIVSTDGSDGGGGGCGGTAARADALEALKARVAALERRLDATLDAFEAEVAERMARAAAEAAEATREHVLAALCEADKENGGE